MSDTPGSYVPIGETMAALLLRNKNWVSRKLAVDSNYFTRLLGQQRPQFFWVGCSDSRVPATEIVDLDPGDVFVHRNVANLAPQHDDNFNAALQYAVEHLGVSDIIVAGHYGCGGIRAATGVPTPDALGRWLEPIHALARRHRLALASIGDQACREERLCELNVIAQVEAIASNVVVCRAWRDGRRLTVHGLVYAIGNGLLLRIGEPVTCSLRGSNEEIFECTAVDEESDNLSNIM